MKKLFLALMILFLLTGAVSASERTLLFRFNGIGVNAELIDAVTMIFQGALAEEGKYQAVYATEFFGDVECYDLTCAISLAEEAGLEKAIFGSLTRLGSKIIARVQLADARKGEIIFSDDGVSQTEEDLDVVLKRLAKSLTSGKKMESTAEVGLITEKEYDEVRRRESYSSKSFNVGFLWPAAGTMGGARRLLVLDLSYQYDTPDFFLTGRSGIRWGGDLDEDKGRALDINFLEVKIGRYLNRADFAPFLNGGIGIHYMREKKRFEIDHGSYIEQIDREDGGTGLILLGGGGFAAFRTYNFQFQIDVDYFIMLEKLNAGEESEGGKYPQGVIFTFCVKKGHNK